MKHYCVSMCTSEESGVAGQQLIHTDRYELESRDISTL